MVMTSIALSCSKSDTTAVTTPTPVDPYTAIKATFGTNIDPANLANYANQGKPAYVNKDNSAGRVILDTKATLGRVLFYDKNLSFDNTISCASCHKQEFAFSDTAIASKGVAGGVTARHSMRLVNARFAVEQKFFWDERAANLEEQTTKPVQDHAEMGFSGQSGRPGIASLLTKLQGINYYNELFKFVYGDIIVSEARLQECLAAFVRSIQSFDSKYDAGRALVANDGQPFPNFTPQENNGKQLFLTAPVFDGTGTRISGGAGCNACHNAPEFDIDPNTGNNGIIGKISGTGIDITVTRAPSLRNLTRAGGLLNGPLMHTANLTDLQTAIGHYGTINLAPGNTNLDPRLRPNGQGQKLNFVAGEVNSIIAFLNTLSGNAVYTDARWSNPFK
ncbi:MAG: cytochrome-c peroxidase [Chitinophagaceae bacterium]|nr:cytochrome-c peroxidase [Chitinophagaceae bacterium]MBL0055565.1 cytochrome-c peroxidase [Chitinophagaceae bacterium]